jgi:hypothetical protein
MKTTCDDAVFSRMKPNSECRQEFSHLLLGFVLIALIGSISIFSATYDRADASGLPHGGDTLDQHSKITQMNSLA